MADQDAFCRLLAIEMATASSLYGPAQPYSSGIHVDRNVPVTGLDDVKLGPLEPPISHDFPPGLFTCPEFFNSMGEECFSSDVKSLDWKYGMRRDAQMVLPFLYLGPVSAVKNLEFLSSEGITLLFAVRSRHAAHARIVNGTKAAAELGIEADSVEIADHQELITAFPQIIRRINDHVCLCTAHRGNLTLSGDARSDIKKKVLVFCETGNERSASVIMAYLMAMLNLDAHTALSAVQVRRLCVDIEEPLKYMLASFESILNAKRDVTRAQHVMPQATLAVDNSSAFQTSQKRSIDAMQDDADTEPNSTEMDTERFSNRNPSAPFHDLPGR
jgi:hypothetical protein